MKLPVTRSSMPDFEEYVSEIKPLWESHWLTNMGTLHNQFTEQLKEYLGVKGLSLFVNGHMALELAIQALKLEGEVITTPFTFASTTHAIVRNGLTPVFCDIRPDDCTIDAEQIESLITEKTAAILPVHVYGNICQVERIQEIADKRGLKVIYDAAHSFGVTYQGTSVAGYGDLSMLSFHATKVFHAIEGGAIVFKDPSIGDKLYELKNFGIRSEEEVVETGLNAKMNEFQAAMGICSLRHLAEEIGKRKKVYEAYQEELSGIEGLTLPMIQKGIQPNYGYFPIFIDETQFGLSRDALYLALKEAGVYSRKYFYPLTSEYACYETKNYRGITPVALRKSREVLTLPIYADLTLEEVRFICQSLKTICGRK